MNKYKQKLTIDEAEFLFNYSIDHSIIITCKTTTDNWVSAAPISTVAEKLDNDIRILYYIGKFIYITKSDYAFYIKNVDELPSNYDYIYFEYTAQDEFNLFNKGNYIRYDLELKSWTNDVKLESIDLEKWWLYAFHVKDLYTIDPTNKVYSDVQLQIMAMDLNSIYVEDKTDNTIFDLENEIDSLEGKVKYIQEDFQKYVSLQNTIDKSRMEMEKLAKSIMEPIEKHNRLT